MKYEVDITQNNIFEGSTGDPHGCAMAIAIGEKFHCPSVTMNEITFSDECDTLSFGTSKKIAQWIKDFDDGILVYPKRLVFDAEEEYAYFSEERQETNSENDKTD